MYYKHSYTTTKAMSDVSEQIGEPLAVWNEQSGGQTYNVIYAGQVYQNQYWVERWHSPGEVGVNGTASPHNAWQWQRAATIQELNDIGDTPGHEVTPIPGDPHPPVLECDKLTEETYEKVDYQPDGSGRSNLSYTASRVCKSMYNEYYEDSSRPKVAAYITDWCQYDSRLDNGVTNDPKDFGRGYDLTKIPATAYDKLVFSFMAVCGDTVGPLAKEIADVVEGWNKQLGPDDPEITEGHIIPVDPYGDLGTTRNVGLPDGTGHYDLSQTNFLPYYNQDRAAGLLGGLRELQNTARLQGHRLDLAFSIGGWSLSGYFSAMAADPAKRRVFIDSILDFFERFPMFSGIDIDWEYPGGGGLESNIFDEVNDGPNYAILIKELRTALDARFGAHDHKEISIASSAVVSKLQKSAIADLIANGLDNIFLMSYDLFGTGWAEHIGHHTNLTSPPGAHPNSGYDLSADTAIKYLRYVLGVPANSIQLGFANYGRACLGADLSGQPVNRSYDMEGRALGTFEKGAPELFDIFNNYFDVEHQLAAGQDDNSFVLMTDTLADADVLYNPTGGHYISLDTPRSVKIKAEYAAKHGLGGIFSWSGDQDNGLLANAAREGAGYVPKPTEKIDMGPLYNPGVPFELEPIIPDNNNIAVLQYDQQTQDAYDQVGYKSDGSGESNLSYTASRVCKSMYNQYVQDNKRAKVSAYITDWCQFDGRLDNIGNPAAYGRGFDLNKVSRTGYDRLVFSFMAVCGDTTGPLADQIATVVDGWNSQLNDGDTPIGNGHIVPIDPYADLGSTRNVGLPEGSGHSGALDEFLAYYNQEDAAGLLGGLRELQKNALLAGHTLELAFSIGGWSLSGYFSDMVKDVDARKTFIDSIIDFFERFPMFSCVDIDWEYPGGGGLESNSFDPENDGPNYAKLIGELRAELDKHFGAGDRKEISIASSAVVAKINRSNIPDLIANGLDNIFLMSYDLFGTGWAEHIGHHTNLLSPPGADPDGDYDLSTDVAIRHLIDNLGVPPEKIHLGYANYGRSCVGANLDTRDYTKDGNALGTFENGAPELFDIFNNYFDVEDPDQGAAGKNGFVLKTDTLADADVLYQEGSGHYISLDTPRTVKLKAEYATAQGLGGVFSWSGDQDCGLLANSAREGAGYELAPAGRKIDMEPFYNTGEAFELKPVPSK
ncbi:hypothetical protein AB835_02565 [Candidatus Endobugula sertula]|uniref:chitinase n=1 Tax=Candidatus Endobugula sertula TaxID=62101 RepID=A0A1D2QSR5_9GAMM|nr:hypothetical protein AB835_02565 [Candidatus Endobugula sertula]